MIHSVNRVTASVLAALLVIFAVFAPVVAARAETVDVASINLTVQADGAAYSVKLCSADTLFALLCAMEQADAVTALNAYLGECGLIAECVPFLPQAYGIDFANLQKNLPNSIFAPGSGGAYALPQEVYNALMVSFGASANASMPSIDPAVLENAIEAVLPHLEPAKDALLCYGQISSSVAPMEPGDWEVSMTEVYLEPEVLAIAFSAFVESIQEDAAAKEAFAQVLAALVAAGVVPDPAMEGTTVAEVMELVWEDMDMLDKKVTSALIARKLHVYAYLALKSETSEFVGCGFAIDGKNVNLGLSVMLGDDFCNVRLLADDEMVDITFCPNTDTDAMFAASIHLAIDDEEVMKLTFTVDWDAGRYLVTAEADGQVLSAGGSILQGSEGQVTITLDTLNDEPVPFQAALTVNPCDRISVPGYQDIVTMSEEDFSALADIFTAIGQMASSMMKVG